MTDLDRQPRGGSPIGDSLDRMWVTRCEPIDQPPEDAVPLFADAARFAAAGLSELAANPLITAIAEHRVGMALTPAEITAITGFIAALEAPRTSPPQPRVMA